MLKRLRSIIRGNSTTSSNEPGNTNSSVDSHTNDTQNTEDNSNNNNAEVINDNNSTESDNVNNNNSKPNRKFKGIRNKDNNTYQFIVWKQLDTPSVVTCRHSHTMVAYGDYIIIFGGFYGDVYYNDLYVYDTKESKWKTIEISEHVPSARAWHSATVYNDKMYLIGGIKDGYFCKSIDILDLKSWAFLPPLTSSKIPRLRSHSATLVDNHIVIFGIYEELVARQYCSIFSPDNITWEEIRVDRSVPKKTLHSATLITDSFSNTNSNNELESGNNNNQDTTTSNDNSSNNNSDNNNNDSGKDIIIFGGFDTEKRTNSLFSLNTKTWKFKELHGNIPVHDLADSENENSINAVYPFPRSFHSADYIGNGKIIIFGGFFGMEAWRNESNIENGILGDFFMLDLKTVTWQKPIFTGIPATPRTNHRTCKVNNKVYLFGGSYGKETPNGPAYNDFYTMEFSWRTPASLFDICTVYIGLNLHQWPELLDEYDNNNAEARSDNNFPLPELLREHLFQFCEQNQL